MDPLRLFEIWAPEHWPWSAWVKPALFAGSSTLEEPRPVTAAPVTVLDPTIPPAGQTALVVDLPGEQSVTLGVELVEHGYQAVPLFNTQGSVGSFEVINVGPIIEAIVRLTPIVMGATLSAQAPPAFLLDSDRLGHRASLRPGDYDNRWVVFPQDLPSATLLRSRGITRVMLIHEDPDPPGRDLDDVLARWSKGGLEIARWAPGETMAEPYRPSRWWTVRLFFLFVLAALSLRRNAAGGFGSRIPEAVSGSGWG